MTATAADIVSVLGVPGDATWTAACGAGASVPNAASPGLIDCAATPWVPLSSCLHRVDIDTSAQGDPLATCSDGTPGVFYGRAGSGNDVDRWVIHLQGGGGCDDETSCQERWCGQQGIYDAAQMSNDWDADGTIDRPLDMWLGGMTIDVPANDFATWNHVYIPYCSSDTWLGRASDVDFDGTSAFTVDARGHKIVQTVRRMLRKRGYNSGWTFSDTTTLPDLDDATEIIFSGTSAGGVGALQNADWFATPFSARTGLVVDGALDISWNAAFSHGLYETGSGYSYYSFSHVRNEELWDPGGYYDEINAFVDQSCMAVYPTAPHQCSSIPKLLLLASGGVPMIETPLMLRFDLADPVIASFFTTSPNPSGDEFVVGGLAGSTPTIDDFASMMRDSLVEYAADPQTNISVHAPKCGVHVGLELNNPTGVWTTPDSSDVPIPVDLGGDATAHDAILEWFDPGSAGFTRIRRIDTDEPGVSFSSC
ncbi:MAG: pectin acetylesterase-family hydrolase [Nannocystaceae bacterium]